MPLTPLLTFVCNGMEIFIRYNFMFSYGRRLQGQSSNGIGVWAEIMKSWAMLSIAINFAIIYFTGDASFETSGESRLVAILTEHSPYEWNSRNILLLVVGVEHAVILFKFAAGYFIPDVPKNVRLDRYRAEYFEKQASDFLKKLRLTDRAKQISTYHNRLLAKQDAAPEDANIQDLEAEVYKELIQIIDKNNTDEINERVQDYMFKFYKNKEPSLTEEEKRKLNDVCTAKTNKPI